MKVYYWPERNLSSKAQDLLEFDMASIRLLTHGAEPGIWLASTDQYEFNGRVLRDSTSPRLLAYFPQDQMVYVTDGCNSCAHPFGMEIPQIRPELLERLDEIIKL